MYSLKIAPEDLIKYCYQCGKCSGICPLGDISFFSPRILIHNAIIGKPTEPQRLAQCSTCDLCSIRCPMDVKISEFVREERHKLRQKGIALDESHFGIFSSLSRLMAKNNYEPNLNNFISKDLKISEDSDILVFTGCLSLFDVYFEKNYSNIANSVIRILNHLKIQPQILKNQKCCGHDLFWGGDYENFKKLGEANIELIEKSGAKQVITICPECYRTFRLDYPRFIKNLPFKVISFTEFLEVKLREGQLNFPYEFPYSVTYQDPCRLGRHMGIYDPPRNLLKAIPGLKLQEMENTRENAICCGVNAWIGCNLYSKSIRMNRLTEAQQKADILITNCPHCLIHFNCLKNEYSENEPKYHLEIIDFNEFIAKALLLG